MIYNYNELIESMADELVRSDLRAKIPEWIQLAELSINRFMGVADSEQFTTDAFVANQAYIDGPLGFKRAIHIEVQTNPLRVLSIVSWDKRSDVLENDLSGKPRTITWLGRRGYIAPVPVDPDTYQLFYYGLPPRLSEENPTNDLLEMGADILKYQALMYSAPYLGDDERLGTWQAIIDRDKTLLKKEYWNTKASGGILRIRTDVAAYDGPQ